MLYCHGWPTSRLEAGLAPPLPVRLIAIDRPGYGLSDPHRGARLRNHTQDIRALARHLGLSRFAVVGVSGGGPLATACAHDLPDLVSALTLISPVPPPHAVSSGSLAMLMRFGRWPRLARPTMSLARRFILSPDRGEAVVFGRHLPGHDGAVMTRERRAALLAAMREGLRPGIAGAVGDAAIYGSPWGFNLADIKVSTTVWHGTDDHLIPPDSVRAYGVIPGAVIHIAEGHGHYSLAIGQTTMIMKELIRRT